MDDRSPVVTHQNIEQVRSQTGHGNCGESVKQNAPQLADSQLLTGGCRWDSADVRAEPAAIAAVIRLADFVSGVEVACCDDE